MIAHGPGLLIVKVQPSESSGPMTEERELNVVYEVHESNELQKRNHETVTKILEEMNDQD